MRISKNDNFTLPGSLEDSVISMYFRDKIIAQVELPVPKKLLSERNYYALNTELNLNLAYLKCERHDVCLSRTGAGEIILKDTKISISTFEWNVDKLLEGISYKVYNFGMFKINNLFYPLKVVHLNKKFVMLFQTTGTASLFFEPNSDTAKSILHIAENVEKSGNLFEVYIHADYGDYENLYVDLGGPSTRLHEFDLEGAWW